MAKLISTRGEGHLPAFGLEWPEGFEVLYVEPSELEPPYSERVLEYCKDVDFIFVGAMDYVQKDIIDKCPKLKAIRSEGASFDKIDYNYCAEKGIVVANSKGANATSVAEHCISLALCAFKRVEYYDHKIREMGYEAADKLFWSQGTRSISEMTIGMIGMGAIGKNVAKRWGGWDANLIYYDPYRPSPEVEAELKMTYMDLPDLIKTADIISIHLPVLPTTIGMIAREQLASMKKTAVLVNVARGDVIVDEDLVWALENDEIAFAALDTVAPEPMPDDHPLRTMSEHAMEKVIFTPHVAGRTRDDFARMLTWSVEDFGKMAKGELPRSVVNGVKELKK